MNKNYFAKVTLLVISLALAGCGSPAAPVASPATPTATARVDLPAASVTPAVIGELSKPPQASPTSQAAQCSPIPMAKSLPALSTSDSHSEIALLDPANGRPACGFQALEFKGWINYAFSDEWKKLAIVAYNGMANQEGVLHIVDMATWQMVTTTLQTLQYASPIIFNPAGTQLAIVENSASADPGQSPAYRLDIYDLATQMLVAQKPLDYTPRVMKYSAGGTRLGIFGETYNVPYGSKPQAHIQLFDAASLELGWEPSLPGALAGSAQPQNPGNDPIFDMWEPGVVFSADGSLLYIAHSEADMLTKVDFEHRTQVSVPIQPRLSWWDRLLRLGTGAAYAKGMNGTTKQARLSPDGTRLYVLGITYQTSQDSSGNFQFNQIPLGLQVIDPASGAELGKVPSEASDFSLSPDGGAIYLIDWQNTPSTEIVDAASLKVKQRQDKGAVVTARLLDGQPVTMLQLFSQLNQLDPQTLSPVGKPWYMGNYSLLLGP